MSVLDGLSHQEISELLDIAPPVSYTHLKALFPKPFEGLDYSTLKNLKAPCSNDVIHIDEPVNGGYDFHDVTEKIPE